MIKNQLTYPAEEGKQLSPAALVGARLPPVLPAMPPGRFVLILIPLAPAPAPATVPPLLPAVGEVLWLLAGVGLLLLLVGVLGFMLKMSAERAVRTTSYQEHK